MRIVSSDANDPFGIGSVSEIRVSWPGDAVEGVARNVQIIGAGYDEDAEATATVHIDEAEADRLGIVWCSFTLRATRDDDGWSDPVVELPVGVDEFNCTDDVERYPLTEVQVVDGE